jgi:ribosomal protein S25
MIDFVNAAPFKPSPDRPRPVGTRWTVPELAAELTRRGLAGYWRGQSYWSQCPHPDHDDRNPSCQIRQGDHGVVVVKCQSGSHTQQQLLEAIGPARPPRHHALTYGGVTHCLCADHWLAIDRQVQDGHGWFLTPHAERELHNLIRQQPNPRVIQRADTTPTSKERARNGRRIRRQLAAGIDPFENTDPPIATPFVLLGDLSRAETPNLLTTPKRTGRVQRAVIADLIEIVNARLAAGENRAVPYSSTQAADRLSIDARVIRKALRGLRAHGVIEKVGELPRRDNCPNGIPLYALRVDAPCPLCTSDVEARPVVARLDSHGPAAGGDGESVFEPCGEQPDLAPVALAQIEHGVDARLAAPVGGAGVAICGGLHARRAYAERRPEGNPRDSGSRLRDTLLALERRGMISTENESAGRDVLAPAPPAQESEAPWTHRRVALAGREASRRRPFPTSSSTAPSRRRATTRGPSRSRRSTTP